MSRKFTKVYGTGGIGSGVLFKLVGNEPLGRDESRPAELTEAKDYCKCHIILHYIAKLTREVAVFPVGMVGKDEQGARLLREMRSAGMDTRFVGMTGRAPTMFSACFMYPDGSGGNITSANSASGLVTPEYVEACVKGIDSECIALAAPEVPVESRIRLLQIAKSRGAFTASSFVAEEAFEFERLGGFIHSDLISINRNEANAVSSGPEAAIKKIAGTNPRAKIIITLGSEGSLLYDGGETTRLECEPAETVSSAGAGDAFLGAVVAGIINGLDFIRAAKFGAKAARISVGSIHTISEEVAIEKMGM